MPSAWEILPELQHLEVRDVLPCDRAHTTVFVVLAAGAGRSPYAWSAQGIIWSII